LDRTQSEEAIHTKIFENNSLAMKLGQKGKNLEDFFEAIQSI
jgi:hypothetical protein